MYFKPSNQANIFKLLPLVALLSAASFALPAQAYDDECKPPKSSYANVSCTADDNYFIARDSNYNNQALLNKRGKKVADLRGYDTIDVWMMNEGVFAVLKNGKVGYMNTQGKLVVPTIYDDLQDPDDKYDETWANPVGEGRIVVAKNGKYGIIDTNNKLIMPFTSKYSFIDGVNEGMVLVVSKSGKYGFVNRNGKEVIAPKYEGTDGHFGGYYGFQQGLAGMYDGKKWGYITKSGKVAVPFVYDEIRPFTESVAGVMKNGKWGFINGANKTVIPFKYSDKNVERYSANFMGANYFIFRDGVAKVASINDKEICINKLAKKVACSY